MKRSVALLLSITLLTACNFPQATPSAGSAFSEPAKASPSAGLAPTALQQPLPSAIPQVNRTTTGTVLSDEIWRGEILVSGDVYVGPQVTLMIEPGTIVRFTAQWDDTHGGSTEDLAIPERKYFPNDPPAIPASMSSIDVDESGRLIAQGTDATPILFTSDSAAAKVNDWQGIHVFGEAMLDHVVIEYAYWAVQFEKAQHLSVSNSTFQHIATCAICPDGGQYRTELVIAGNTFVDCGHEGIETRGGQNIVVRGNRFLDNIVGVIANDGSTIRIEGNLFEGNTTAISINNGGNPVIVGNEITSSTQVGIWLYEGSSANITNNNIYGNASNLGLGRSPGSDEAANNWWGTSDPSAISASIYDGNDEPGLGFVNYQPFALAPFNLGIP